MSGLTKDDIIRMARMSADYWANHYDRKSKADMELLRKHVAEKFLEIAAAEREACASILDQNVAVCGTNSVMGDVLASNALAIRARGDA